MCTVTFIPVRNGYHLGMNRDERTSRPLASLPEVYARDAIESIYPWDLEGGTWVGVNSVGNAFTLLNWNDTEVLQAKVHSRGSVIPALIGASNTQAAHSTLCNLDLQGILPFTLVGFFVEQEAAVMWRWDQRSLQSELVPWKMRQWCSSSLSDAQASLQRGKAFAMAACESGGGSRDWLRRLHSSHAPGDRPFSTCVHRGGVQTVSYTELTCTGRRVKCKYVVGSPCQVAGMTHCVSIPRIPVLGQLQAWKERPTRGSFRLSVVP